MKIGFDISQTGNGRAGCGFFADSLIQALTEADRENEYLLYPYFGNDFVEPDAERNTRKINLPNVKRIITGNSFDETMAFWGSFSSGGEQHLGYPDIIHANNFFCPNGLEKAKLVYTLYDLNFLEFPQFTTEHNRWVCFKGVYNASVSADFIVSISDYSRTKFLELFPHYPTDRIKTIHLGSRFKDDNSASMKKPEQERIVAEKFWLAVGTLEPRKNLRGLLKAFAEYTRGSGNKFPLVLAGGKGWMEEGLEGYIDQLGIKNDVILTGYVTDEELLWLYKNCFAFLYLSLYEGFGLPVLEAMGLGAPVITSNTTSIPEVAGNACCLVDPQDNEQMIKAFYRMGSKPEYRSELSRRAVEQAKRFSWQNSSSEVLEIYNDVVALPKYTNTKRA